jgi:hypothetical protein
MNLFEGVHNASKRGNALLAALMELLVSYDPGLHSEPSQTPLIPPAACRPTLLAAWWTMGRALSLALPL